ncbi:hypothetical protein RND71_019513 [Anisodus tanguticus]|uniref:Peptidase M24 C-terminal domain-containing protein n=1 Tax=Anisodus tanguticus TaxID=243964 RepID=A0AAE1S0Z8_9SOLA|nr:hypothetical protein RND71_019513 [Anisodus tanguticus]
MAAIWRFLPLKEEAGYLLEFPEILEAEPGYYEDGKFGIRLENVLIVKEGNTKFNFGDKGYLTFEHITWAPYQRKLIDLSLLVPEEIQWVGIQCSLLGSKFNALNSASTAFGDGGAGKN